MSHSLKKNSYRKYKNVKNSRRINTKRRNMSKRVSKRVSKRLSKRVYKGHSRTMYRRMRLKKWRNASF